MFCQPSVLLGRHMSLVGGDKGSDRKRTRGIGKERKKKKKKRKEKERERKEVPQGEGERLRESYLATWPILTGPFKNQSNFNKTP